MSAKNIVGLILGIISIGMVALLIVNTGDNSGEQTNQQNDESAQSRQEDNEQSSAENSFVAQFPHLKGANIGNEVDATGKTDVTVSIDDFIFDKTILTVDRGTTVTWVNNGDVGHNVATATGSEIQIGTGEILRTGETFKHTFNEAGTLLYLCSPHPTQMRGVVVVK
jgi:plastocyanin